MKVQALILGLAAGCTFANEQKDKPSSSADHAQAWEPVHTPKWAATVAPEKISSLDKDMQALATSVHGNKLYSSMTAVMETAIPQSFKDAMATNMKSIHREYKTATPDWYKAIPSDVRHFMEENKKAAKSIFSKDIGPMPTGAHGTSSGKGPQETGKSKDGKVGQKSEAADSMRMVGATTAALLATFGFAMLLL